MLCSDTNTHCQEKKHYEDLLRRDGYGKITLKYKTPETEEEKKERMRKKKINGKKARDVTWFNPPY